MRRYTSALLALVICLSLITGTVFARQTAARNPEQLFKEMMLQLDELEQRVPRSQSEIYQLRAGINELYSHITRGSSTDPVDENGELLAADHEVGSDLYYSCQGLTDRELKAALLKVIDNHVSIGYQAAQDAVFSDLDNRNGYVEGVYTGRLLKTAGEPNATNMNIEHTWPQSQGAVGIAKCDLHHLFPADSKANGIRGHNPFGNVDSPTWQQGGSKTDKSVFEVRKEQRGNTARGMFYFSVRYNMRISEAQEETLKQWNKEDPVDEFEKKRNDRIENYQHNRNPFVDCPEFVDRIADF